MSLFYPYPHHQLQLLTPLTMQSYHPLGSYFRPSLFSALNNTAQELEKWADESHKLLSSRRRQGASASSPTFTIEDTEHAYLLQAQLPGMTSDDVTVDFPNNTTLSVKGYIETIKHEGSEPEPTPTEPTKAIETTPPQPTPETQEQAPEASQDNSTTPDQTVQKSTQSPLSPKPRSRYRVTHRSVSQFQRTFTLPDGIDRSGVTTTFEDGKLKIVVPKPGALKGAEQSTEPEQEMQVDSQTSEGSDDSPVSPMTESDLVDTSETKDVKGKGKKVQIETVDE